LSISHIKASNFRSFRELNASLEGLSVIVGANASGKTNFVQVFRFLRDAFREGLDNAIAMQGGPSSIANMKIGCKDNVVIEATLDSILYNWPWPVLREKGRVKSGYYAVKIRRAVYRLELSFKVRGKGMKQAADRLSLDCDFCEVKRKGKNLAPTDKKLFDGTITISSTSKRKRSAVSVKCNSDVPIDSDDLFPKPLRQWFMKRKGRGDVPSAPYFDLLGINEEFRGISIYDFDPRVAKKGTPIAGKARLEEDGSNLALVLKRILGESEDKERMLRIFREILPFVEDLDTADSADRNVLMRLREKYCHESYLFAPFMSDGTVNVAALVVALYFTRKGGLLIIEEPERNVHPHLIDKIVEMMEDASRERQIIATTHNPILVGSINPNKVLLVKRDQDGFSLVERPADQKEFQEFLSKEIGLGTLLEQNLLSDLR